MLQSRGSPDTALREHAALVPEPFLQNLDIYYMHVLANTRRLMVTFFSHSTFRVWPSQGISKIDPFIIIFRMPSALKPTPVVYPALW